MICKDSGNYKRMSKLMTRILSQKKHHMSNQERQMYEESFKEQVNSLRESIRKIEYFMQVPKYHMYKRALVQYKIRLTKELISVC